MNDEGDPEVDDVLGGEELSGGEPTVETLRQSDEPAADSQPQQTQQVLKPRVDDAAASHVNHNGVWLAMVALALLVGLGLGYLLGAAS